MMYRKLNVLNLEPEDRSWNGSSKANVLLWTPSEDSTAELYEPLRTSVGIFYTIISCNLLWLGHSISIERLSNFVFIYFFRKEKRKHNVTSFRYFVKRKWQANVRLLTDKKIRRFLTFRFYYNRIQYPVDRYFWYLMENYELRQR